MKKDRPDDESDLRRVAERKLKTVGSSVHPPTTELDALRLVHELQVHQIELEMQNEELRAAQVAVTAGLERYADLYDFAPVGYFTLDRQGHISLVNLTGAKLLGVERSLLVKRPFAVFISPESRFAFSTFIERVFESGTKRTLEAPLISDVGATTYVQIEAAVPDDADECRLAVIDISERKRIEQALRDAEDHKTDFYRRTISAATDGKLVIACAMEIAEMAGPPLSRWEINGPEDVGTVRHGVEELARSARMDEARLGQLVVVVGEAATNAIKHASHGNASLHRKDGTMIFVVSDDGTGIPTLMLPSVALCPSYSTSGTLGIGYKMMIRFADRVYLATGLEGTTVAMEMGMRSTEETSEMAWAEEFSGDMP